MLRGCGIAGLRGMPARRGHYVRPMLNVWREEVNELLDRRGLLPHEDPANRDLRFARVRVRLHILPALERDRPGITRRFHAAALAAARFQDEAEKAPTDVEILKGLYTAAGGSQPGLSRRHLEAMRSVARSGRGGGGVDLPGGLRFRIVGGHMQIVSSQPRPRAETRLVVKSCAGCEDPAAVHLREGLDLRLGYRRPGLRMRPAGGRGTRKLQDIFIDARLPREDRDAWPLVFAGDRLAWVPGHAVDASLVARQGEPAAHVSLTPMPVSSASKVARLEIPRGNRI